MTLALFVSAKFSPLKRIDITLISRFRLICAACLLTFVLPAGAKAQDPPASNPANPLAGQNGSPLQGFHPQGPWSFQQVIVGTTSTGTQAAGGNPIFMPSMPQQSGVASLIITKSGIGSFGCTGALLDDRRSILTAAHCITDSSGNLNAIAATAYFYAGSASSPYNPDTVVPGNPLATAVAVTNFYAAPGYSGKVIEDDDLAVLRLSNDAPSFAQGYDLYTGNLSTLAFTVAGYGVRSNNGGSTGYNPGLGQGILRQGENRYDLQWGDPNFNGVFASNPTFSSGLNTWVADFDSGLSSNDANCLLTVSANPSLGTNSPYCNLGRGAMEATVGAGDSGGPGFVNGKIASVTSYVGSFGQTFGDIDSTTNGTFGEIAGYVPVSLHLAFIESVKVPAPLPIVGTGAMVAWSRRLRRRIQDSSSPL
jgi:hypothetical protein